MIMSLTGTTRKINSILVSVLILAGLVSFIPAQQAAAIPADWTFSCAPGVTATLAGITITKNGNPIGSIPGPISCPPTASGTVDLSELGANDIRVAQAAMTTPTGSFGPNPCSFGPPADLSAGIAFDGDPLASPPAVACSQGPGTDALFTLVEPQAVVGGEVMSIDTTALFVAGAFTNAYWILPAIGAAIAGFGIFRIKK